MKKSILYAVAAVAIVAVAAITIGGCDGDLGERSNNMDAYLDKFHYNKKAVKKFTVTYNGNEATSGIAPVDEKSPYDSGLTVLIKTDKGTLSNGNAMFSGWNDQSDGKGKYSGSTASSTPFIIERDMIFYAQWNTDVTFEVTVTSSLAGTFVYGGRNYKPGEPVIITAGTPPEGWKFDKWTTKSTGVDFVDAGSASTSFIMPENKVTVTANYVATDGKIGMFTDSRDNKTYVTTTIAEQTWMARNLDYLNDMSSGDSSWCYDNDPDNCFTYGRLYNWDAAMKACPAGWKLPDTADWNRLFSAVGGKDVAGAYLKSDIYGFSALMGGARNWGSSDFDEIGYSGYWWTSTETSSGTAGIWVMGKDLGFVRDGSANYNFKSSGLSVRCIKKD